MGKPADGRSYVRIATPPGLNRLTGKKKDVTGHDVLLELYDQVATVSDKAMINDDAWYEVAMTQKLIEAKNPKLKKEAKAREEANKKIAEIINAENKCAPSPPTCHHRPPARLVADDDHRHLQKPRCHPPPGHAQGRHEGDRGGAHRAVEESRRGGRWAPAARADGHAARAAAAPAPQAADGSGEALRGEGEA